MKKLVLLAGAAFMFAAPAMAQPTDKGRENVEIQIEGNRVIIEGEDLTELSQVDLNNILREVSKRSQSIMQQHHELMTQVDKQLANGDITEEQAEQMREMIADHTEQSMQVIGELMEMWGEQYEARMENWEAEYEEQMEAWEAEVESRAEEGDFVMPPLPPIPAVPAPDQQAAAPGDSAKDTSAPTIIIDENGIIIRRGEGGEEPFALRFQDKKEKRPEEREKPTAVDVDRTEGYVDVHLGFNQMLRNGTHLITTGDEELNFWKSTDFTLGMGGKTRLGSPYSKFYLKWGGEFSWHNFRLTGQNALLRNDISGDVRISSDTTRNLALSKYRILYFSVPLMFQLDLSEVGEMDDSFTLGVGGYAGVRVGTKRTLEYSNATFDYAEEVIRDDFYTNQFRYGVMAQVGWGNFKITGKYDLNPFFQSGRGPDYQMASITFGFTLI